MSEQVIGVCMEIHKTLCPGLLESAYEECVCYELSMAGLMFERQKPLTVVYKGVVLECGYRPDLVVEQSLIVEVKAVERLLPVHEAQLLTCLKLTGLTLGLLVNFHSAALLNGLKRMVNNFYEGKLGDEPSSSLCASASLR